MDWFETLTGFRETSYAATRQNLRIDGDQLTSLVNGKSYAIGQLELVSLLTLRERLRTSDRPKGRLKVSVIEGDVRRLHRLPENATALFQVASQFNLLEMIDSKVTPEDGVTTYQKDHTQGPACAIAAGAATIYRNYFVPVAGIPGQTKLRQLDGLADIGAALSLALGMPIADLWTMENGYALPTATGLDAIAAHLAGLNANQLDDLLVQLRIGLVTDAEVTEAQGPDRLLVSQAFCSALPVTYARLHNGPWSAFARLVLDAAYEATLCAAVLNAQRGASNIVFLTLIGGGAFGNDLQWIYAAMQRAFRLMRHEELDVRVVSYQKPSSALVEAMRLT